MIRKAVGSECGVLRKHCLWPVGIVLAALLGLPVLAGDDSSIYKKKVQLPRSNPMYRVFPAAEKIYEVEYTDDYRQTLGELQQAGMQESLVASEAVSAWMNPQMVCQPPSLSNPDRNRSSYLWDGYQDLEIVDISLNSTIRWYLSTVSKPDSGTPSYTWLPVTTYVDEYFEWTKPGESQPTGYEMLNAFQLNVDSGCLGAGYWDQSIPNDTNLLGVYKIVWMYAHTDPGDHQTGLPIYDYKHGYWYQMKMRIYSSTTSY